MSKKRVFIVPSGKLKWQLIDNSGKKYGEGTIDKLIKKEEKYKNKKRRD